MCDLLCVCVAMLFVIYLLMIVMCGYLFVVSRPSIGVCVLRTTLLYVCYVFVCCVVCTKLCLFCCNMCVVCCVMCCCLCKLCVCCVLFDVFYLLCPICCYVLFELCDVCCVCVVLCLVVVVCMVHRLFLLLSLCVCVCI